MGLSLSLQRRLRRADFGEYQYFIRLETCGGQNQDGECFSVQKLYSEQLVMKRIPFLIFPAGTLIPTGGMKCFQNGFITNNNISVTGLLKHSFIWGWGILYEQRKYKAREVPTKITLNASNEYKDNRQDKVGFQFNGHVYCLLIVNQS